MTMTIERLGGHQPIEISQAERRLETWSSMYRETNARHGLSAHGTHSGVWALEWNTDPTRGFPGVAFNKVLVEGRIPDTGVTLPLKVVHESEVATAPCSCCGEEGMVLGRVETLRGGGDRMEIGVYHCNGIQPLQKHGTEIAPAANNYITVPGLQDDAERVARFLV